MAVIVLSTLLQKHKQNPFDYFLHAILRPSVGFSFDLI